MKEPIIQRLEEFIASKGWNKSEFARKVGIYAQDVNRYLDGTNNISRLFVPLYYLGCNLHWLIDNEETYNEDIKPSNMLNHNKELQLNQEIAFLKGRLEEKENMIDKLLNREFNSKEVNEVVATSINC